MIAFPQRFAQLIRPVAIGGSDRRTARYGRPPTSSWRVAGPTASIGTRPCPQKPGEVTVGRHEERSRSRCFPTGGARAQPHLERLARNRRGGSRHGV